MATVNSILMKELPSKYDKSYHPVVNFYVNQKRVIRHYKLFPS